MNQAPHCSLQVSLRDALDVQSEKSWNRFASCFEALLEGLIFGLSTQEDPCHILLTPSNKHGTHVDINFEMLKFLNKKYCCLGERQARLTHKSIFRGHTTIWYLDCCLMMSPIRMPYTLRYKKQSAKQSKSLILNQKYISEHGI